MDSDGERIIVIVDSRGIAVSVTVNGQLIKIKILLPIQLHSAF